MRIFYAVSMLTLVLAACGGLRFAKEGATEAEQARDRDECMAMAQQAAGPPPEPEGFCLLDETYRGQYEELVDKYAGDCLIGRGYRLIERKPRFHPFCP